MFAPGSANADWTPAVDIYDSGNGWLVYVELPGVVTEDVDLTVFHESILLTGLKRVPAERMIAHKLEIASGYFHRKIDLPGRIDISGVTASLDDGLLRIVVPAKEENITRIRVSGNGEKEDE